MKIVFKKIEISDELKEKYNLRILRKTYYNPTNKLKIKRQLSAKNT